MQPDLLPAIAAFTRIARLGSFTRAAVELRVSPSALSQTMRTLEDRLGVRLLERTTRRVDVTSAGRRFLDEAESGISTLAGAVAGLDESRDRPSGLLRLNVSRAAADIAVLPHLAAFMRAYPDIVPEIHCANELLDVRSERFDAGIRLGDAVAREMVAVPVTGPQRLATFASPAYVAEHGAPRTPDDLVRHRCLNGRLPSTGSAYRWEYADRGRTFAVDSGDALMSNDGGFLVEAARGGSGVGCGFEAVVRPYFDDASLVPLLEAWWPAFAGFHLYYPSRRNIPRRLRVFIDFMQARARPGARGRQVRA